MRPRTASKKRRNKKLLVMGMVLFCVAFNMGLTSRASTDPVVVVDVHHMQVPSMTFSLTDERGSVVEGSRGRQPRIRRRPRPEDLVVTMAPQESSKHTVGMVHVGKTAGSTISQLLRNGCTSFVTEPCRMNISQESEISRQVEHYYHVPDFHRLPIAKHYSFIISVRDVYERTVSSFLYHHPKNAAINQVKLTRNHEQYGPIAYSCFDTLDEFAVQLHGASSPDQCDYPYPINVVDASNCKALACAALHGKARFFIHLFFNFRNILYTKLPQDPPRLLFAIRQEFLWNDWEVVNRMLGQTDPVYIPPTHFNQRNISGLALPIGKSITSKGRELLCTALKDEYEAYFRILHRSKNLGPDDLEASIQVSEKRCPNLDLRGMVARLE